MGHVIEVRNVSRRFGKAKAFALDSVSLTVPEGAVFGLVGENGAGKTTLLKHLLGAYRPQAGSVRVFGLDPTVDPVGVLSRIGYLSEDRAMPEWMTVSELMRYTASFYSGWSDRQANDLVDAFALPRQQRISKLSRGQRARMGLLLALAHRPQLLLLDEPSSGLDPTVRRDILDQIIRTVANEGRTVVFSSHLLDEVQRVADQLAMLDHGQVVMMGSLDDLLGSHQRLTVRLQTAVASPPELKGVLRMEGEGQEWTMVCNGEREQLEQQLRAMGADIVERGQPSLEEIFVARSTALQRS